jgi:predicted cupin superfamily sugar epimerase
VTESDRTADELIELLNLRPHPEGGFFVETWRHVPEEGGRGAGSAIYFLLREGFASASHRVDADEAWHFYAGAPVELVIGEGTHRLGIDFAAGERPQLVVPAHEWQSARTLGEWSLVGCTVSPAFEFEGFELAPEAHEAPSAKGPAADSPHED